MPNPTLTVGSLVARPGEKTFGVNEITVQGQPYRLPMWVVNGEHEGPTLAVTAGLHPAEYACIGGVLETGRKISSATVAGRVVLVPIMNLPGFNVRSMTINPMDGKNMNRVFPGNKDGTASEQIAGWVFQNVIKQANYYVDLHGGDLIEALTPFTEVPTSGNDTVDRAALEMAKAFGIPCLVRNDIAGSAYSAAAALGIPSILAEAGGQGIWTAEDERLHADGLSRLMQHLRMLPGGEPETVPHTLLERFIVVLSERNGFWYPAVSVGDDVAAGQILGVVKEYEGDVLQTVICPADGRLLFLVTSLAINNGEPFLAVGAYV
jgi:predicted deacylase